MTTNVATDLVFVALDSPRSLVSANVTIIAKFQVLKIEKFLAPPPPRNRLRSVGRTAEASDLIQVAGDSYGSLVFEKQVFREMWLVLRRLRPPQAAVGSRVARRAALNTP